MPIILASQEEKVPDVREELRIFANNDTAFKAFGKAFYYGYGQSLGHYNLTKRFKLAVLCGENS